MSLELPSQHHGASITSTDLMSYRSRPKEEILCDIFAAECLLPYGHFINDIDDLDISLDKVKELAKHYKASITSTGSRFAINCGIPCAFVLMEHGNVRYASMSKFLRELNGWIEIGVPIPKGSVASKIINNAPSSNETYGEVQTDVWFTNNVRGFDVVAEESMFLREWSQCLSLLWFDDDLRAIGEPQKFDEDEPLLKELDGVLPWPSKSRRKK